MSTANHDVDVLIAGAGPVGLTAAHELTRRGVSVRIIDRAAGPAVTSRATANHARVLEVYHQMGVYDDILARGQKVDTFTVHQGGKERTRLLTNFSQLPTRYPFTLQVDQVLVEEVLREHLAAQGVKIEWNTALTELDQQAEQVSATLTGAGGDTEQVTVPWLIGADGAHSVVRKQLGLELLGQNSETWLIADAIIDFELPRTSLHWMHTKKGAIMLVPFPAEGKWRLLDTVEVHDADQPELIAARFAAKIAEASGRPAIVHTPSWVSVFTIRQRMIQQMRAGRCFVAGDAAHVHSPASGQGMNTGIQDAHNLAWKLAEVIHGEAQEALLDSYSAERVPIGERLLKSTETATALVGLRTVATEVFLPLGTKALNLLKPVKRMVEGKVQHTMSGLALSYPDSPLTTEGPAGVGGGIAVGERVGCTGEQAQASPGWQALVAEFADPRWVLLAFAGDQDRQAVLAEVAAKYPAVSVRTVSAAGTAGPNPLADPDSRLAASIGAGPDTFALIRPDAYLATKAGLSELGSALAAAHLRPVG